MTKRKSTKRTLLLSALSLLMCVSMLIGSTFAWFTDSVTSAGNKIQAGSLKIDLELLDKDGNWNSIKNSQAAIFNYDKWEPGYTDVKILKIENEGSLALKWYAKFTAETTLSKLADVIDVYVCPSADVLAYPADRDLTGYTKVGTVAEFVNTIEQTTKGTLLPKDDQGNGGVAYLGIALKMQETAGNEYQGLDLGGAFDIQILATQYTYEKDSFDDQYDANLETSENGESRELPDGSTIFYYNEESGFGDRVRLTALPENLGNEYVVPADVNDLGGALVGVNLDKLTIPTGVKNAYKSLEGANINEVVIADGATVVPNRMFYKANVEEIVIPETVTTIEENAFAMATAEELVIPASVTRVGEAAFQHMDKLKTVIFKGNVDIEGYAFRGCDVLRTVYLEGEDVNFVVSATGKNSCWFCNGESNNPNTSNITFYVENATVAARVKVAMGAEANNTPVYINEKIYVPVKNLTEFQKALDNAVNNTLICLTADINGDVTFTQKNDVTLVLDGNGKKMDGTINITARADTANAATLTIKNFNFETTTDRSFIHSVENNRYPNNVTIANCTFKGTGANSNVVAVTVKSANNLVIKDCKADNVHSLLQNTSGWNLTVKDCEITNSGRGMSLGTVQGALIENVKIEASAEKYGIRMDAGYNNNAVITDCNVKAFIPVVVRKASVNSNVTFNGENTMTAINTDGIWCAIGTSEYEANGVMPTAATASVTVTLNDAGLNANGVYGAAAIN